MDILALQHLRDLFKREVISRVGMIDERLRPVVVDIDLRVDDLYVEFRAASSPVVYELRDRLRRRVDRLYELMTQLDPVWRSYGRAVYAYAQYALLYQQQSAPALVAMRQLFERELCVVKVMPASLR